MSEVTVTYKNSRQPPRIITAQPRVMEQDRSQLLAAAFAAADPKPQDGQEPSGRDNEDKK